IDLEGPSRTAPESDGRGRRATHDRRHTKCASRPAGAAPAPCLVRCTGFASAREKRGGSGASPGGWLGDVRAATAHARVDRGLHGLEGVRTEGAGKEGAPPEPPGCDPDPGGLAA